MATIAAFLVIAGFAWAIHHAPRSSGRGPFRLEQFRPAAPLASLFSDDADAERQFRDVAAVHAHMEGGDVVGSAKAADDDAHFGRAA